MGGILNRVGMVIADTGAGDVDEGVVISNKFNTPAEAGAVDGQSYWWCFEQDNDYELIDAVWHSDGTISRSTGTVAESKIAGSHSTTKMTLAAGALMRSALPKEVIAALTAAIAAKLSLSGGTLTGPLTLNADGSSALHAVTLQQLQALAANVGKRARVRAATTANITISTALNNGDTLDGVTLATGDLVLVKDQSSGSQNGVYTVGVTPARAPEFDTYNEHPGSLIAVQEGTVNADTLWLCTSNDGGTIDSTSIAFTAFAPATAAAIAAATQGASNKSAIVDADKFGIVDTEASNGWKYFTWANLKAALLGSTIISSTAQFWANVASKILTTDQVWAAGAEVAITPPATPTMTVTFTNSSSAVGATSHGLSVDAPVHLTTSGGLPTNFAINTEYYVKTVTDANTIILSATRGGAAITAGSAGSGTHTMTKRLLIDFSLGFNFTIAMAGNYTLAKPYNSKPGQGARITLTQDGTGTRTLTIPASGGWEAVGGLAGIVLSTAASTKDRLRYDCISTTLVELALGKAVA